MVMEDALELATIFAIPRQTAQSRKPARIMIKVRIAVPSTGRKTLLSLLVLVTQMSEKFSQQFRRFQWRALIPVVLDSVQIAWYLEVAAHQQKNPRSPQAPPEPTDLDPNVLAGSPSLLIGSDCGVTKIIRGGECNGGISLSREGFELLW
jgi:hypothetical protein